MQYKEVCLVQHAHAHHMILEVLILHAGKTREKKNDFTKDASLVRNLY